MSLILRLARRIIGHVVHEWYTVRVLVRGTVIMEVKDGAYEPIGPEDIME